MKALYLNSLLIAVILMLLTSCNGTKSQNVVIIHSTSKMFAVGEPQVIFKSNRAMLNYFCPGAIVICKVDYNILNQQGLSGSVYRIDKNSKLIKLESIDTSLLNKDIAIKYLYTKGLVNDEIELEEIILN